MYVTQHFTTSFLLLTRRVETDKSRSKDAGLRLRTRSEMMVKVGVRLEQNAVPNHVSQPLACDFHVDGAVDDSEDQVDFVFLVLSHKSQATTSEEVKKERKKKTPTPTMVATWSSMRMTRGCDDTVCPPSQTDVGKYPAHFLECHVY